MVPKLILEGDAYWGGREGGREGSDLEFHGWWGMGVKFAKGYCLSFECHYL